MEVVGPTYRVPEREESDEDDDDKDVDVESEFSSVSDDVMEEVEEENDS